MGLFDVGAFSQQPGWLSALLQNPDIFSPGGVPQSNGFGQQRPQTPGMDAMAQAPPIGAPQMPQQQAGPGFGDRMVAGASNFSDPRLGLLSRLVNSAQGMATGQRTDPQGMQQAQQKATYEALLPKLGPAGAAAAMANPKVLESWATREFAPYTAQTTGDIGSSFDPRTGNYRPQVQAPRYEKVGPGEKLYAVGGGVPGATAPREIGSGGPEKPPQGYDWVDKSNPAAGVAPIAGGPEAKLPANEAGYLAMMNASMGGLANARKFFLDPSFKGGVINSAGNAIGQATGSFDIGRAQRDIKMATETALRIMTGAAAPETEVKRYADLFTPSVYDNHETRAQKLNNLENFLSQAKTNMTAGRVAPADNVGWVGVGNGARIRVKP